MTIKNYQTIKIIIVIALAIVFSQSIIYQNYFLSIGLLIAATLIMYSMRKQVKEVLNDERDYATGGKAALVAMQVYCWISVIVMFFFKSQAYFNPAYDVIATTIAFSVCIFMLLYGFIYRLYNKNSFWNKETIIVFLILLFFIVLGFLGILKF